MASPLYSPFSPAASPRLPTHQSEEDKCSVCLEAPNCPRLLPCLHVFCTHCIQGLLDDVDPGQKLVCPNCRAEHDAPLNAVDFRLDPAAREKHSICDVSKEMGGLCKSCEENDETVAYCRECEGGICEECVGLHRRKMKAFRDHQYAIWSEIDSLKPTRPQQTCRFHEGMAIQLYCEACESFICAHCLKERHMTHPERTESLMIVKKKKLAEMKKMTDTADKQLCDLRSRISQIKQSKECSLDYSKSLDESITRTFQEYMKQLKVWHDQLVNEAHERCHQRVKSLSAQQTDAENAMTKLETGIKYGRNAASSPNDDDIIQICDLSINQLKGALKDHIIPPLQRPLVFERCDQKLGGLREIEERDIQVLPPKYCFMNSDNEISVKFNPPINTFPEIMVLYGSQKQGGVTLRPTTPLPVNDSCTFMFFPRCAGKHTIEVLVGGVKCKSHHDAMVVRGVPEQNNRVKPGPDWKGSDKIKTGTVLLADQVTLPRQFGDLEDDGVEQESFKVKVQWDNNEVMDYDWGDNDEYELEVDLVYNFGV